MFERLIISAPFGNWFQYPFATSTLGTYTADYRGGFWYRLWRVLRTVRYYHGIRAWKNQLGLPNPGIDALVDSTRTAYDAGLKGDFIDVADKIVSVAAHSVPDWERVLRKALPLKPLAIEANVSCPNCPGQDKTNYLSALGEISALCAQYKVPLVVKLPPVGYKRLVESAVSYGITRFHCCNTIPTARGGISGKPLKPLSLECVSFVRSMLAKANVPTEKITVIGGGGITHADDASDFLAAGATNVAVASVLFNPLAWTRVRKIANDLAVGAALMNYMAVHPVDEISEKRGK